jgi:hypothetical protein
MTVATIQIKVGEKTAQLYKKAAKEDQEKIQLLLSLWVSEFENSDILLIDLMDDVSEKAQTRGLTPEILEALLKDGRKIITHT